MGTGRGYLQHRRNIEADFEQQVGGAKRRSRAPISMAEFNEEAKNGLYTDEKKRPYLPSMHIEQSLVKGGSAFQIRGQGKKTYKGDMLASIMVLPERIPISPPDWSVDIAAVKIQGKQTFRARPLFKKGWKAKFEVQITNPDLQPSAVKDILQHVGVHVGIGDYRPRYGQFEITKWEEE